jgi:dethiobiotin synthetase
MRRGLFVTATDTGVGKTVASAALMHALRAQVLGADSEQAASRLRARPEHAPSMLRAVSEQAPSMLGATPHGLGSDAGLTPRYWKPVQTGIEQDDDTAEVARLGACSEPEILDRGIRLERPLSPHLSARLAGRTISIDDVVATAGPDLDEGTWIVEGAGGVLVPLNDTELMIDLMCRLALPVAIVARTALGTINHTLLTIEALRRRSLHVAGVILCGAANTENRDAIAKYGGVSILGEMPRFDPLTADALGTWARAHLHVESAL